MEFILYIIFAVLFSVIGFAVQKSQVRKFEQIAEEDAPEPAFEMPTMSELRSNPRVLESLRGKVVSVVYNPCVEVRNHGRVQITIEESFLIDSNGAIQTIERRQTGGASTEVEENARWLANALDVEFVT